MKDLIHQVVSVCYALEITTIPKPVKKIESGDIGEYSKVRDNRDDSIHGYQRVREIIEVNILIGDTTRGTLIFTIHPKRVHSSSNSLTYTCRYMSDPQWCKI